MTVGARLTWAHGCAVIVTLCLYADVTAEEFISSSVSSSSSSSSSQYVRLRALIASTLGVPVDNVDVFVVRDHPSLPRTVDVRYSAHGSPVYRQTRLDGLLSLRVAQVIHCLHGRVFLRKKSQLHKISPFPPLSDFLFP